MPGDDGQMQLPRQGRRIRLLVISPYFAPDRGGGSAVNTDLCLGLNQRHFEITVWTTYPHYPEWTDKSGSNGWRIQKEPLEQLQICRFGLFIPRHPGRLWQRLLYEASFFFSVLRNLHRAKDHDVIMAFCPLVSSVGVGAIASLIFRKPLWLNVQDLAAEAATAGGIIKGGFFSRLLRWFQSALFNQASVWSTISPVMARRLEPMRKHGQPIHYLPNWLNDSLGKEISKLGPKVAHTPGSPLRLLYAGNFGRKQNLIQLLRSLKSSRERFHFQLHGNGADYAAISQWFSTNDDARFELGPFLGEKDFAAAIHECDLFVLPEIDSSGDSFLPSKLTAIIATGTPIFCISEASSPLGYEVSSSQLGPMLRWQDMDQLDKLLSSIAADSARLKVWQDNALRRSTFFSRDRIIDSFGSELNKLVNAST